VDHRGRLDAAIERMAHLSEESVMLSSIKKMEGVVASPDQVL
jgi:hypothetical protein